MNGSPAAKKLEDVPIVNPITGTLKKKYNIKPGRIIRRIKKTKFNVICFCGVHFIANHNQAKYCSDECKKVAYYKSQDKYRETKTEDMWEHSREYYRNYYEQHAEEVIAKTSEYQQTKRGKIARKVSDSHQKGKFPERVHARQIFNKLIVSGRLPKQPCEKCGAEKVHGHHDDYSKPEEVRWLCCKCHAKHHKELRKLLREYSKL